MACAGGAHETRDDQRTLSSETMATRVSLSDMATVGVGGCREKREGELESCEYELAVALNALSLLGRSRVVDGWPNDGDCLSLEPACRQRTKIFARVTVPTGSSSTKRRQNSLQRNLSIKRGITYKQVDSNSGTSANRHISICTVAERWTELNPHSGPVYFLSSPSMYRRKWCLGRRGGPTQGRTTSGGL
jgi:hypothetical protein